MTATHQHLRLAREAHDRLAGGAAAMALWAAGLHVGIDRTEIFRASRYPAPPARARAIAVYILTTYLDFHGDDAAVVIGVADRKHVRKLKMRVIDERENDAALDRFLDDIGALIEGRRAA